jgi:acyl-CoA thioester hydrolase
MDVLARVGFDLPHPHVLPLTVDDADIDAYNHVNNAVYVRWCDLVAWDHSAALGLPLARCLELDRGMAVIRTLISYARPAVLGDQVQIATWILPSESRLCIRRRFQIVRSERGETLARAEVEYACIELSSGKPVRWPAEFRGRYVALADVTAAAQTLPAL